MFNDMQNIEKKCPVVTMDDGCQILDGLDIVGRSPNIVYIFGLLSAVAVSGVSYLFNKGDTEPSAFLPMVFSIFFIAIIFLVRKFASAKPFNYLSPEVFFIAVYGVFHFSYIIFYAIKMVPSDPEVFWGPTHVLRAVFYCICCLCAFLLSYEISGGRPNLSQYSILESPSPIIILIAKILIVICIIFFWGVIFSAGFFQILSDYQALTRIGTTTAFGRLFFVSQNIALIAIAMYSAASGLIYQKFMAGKVFPFIALGFIIGILILGDRGGFIFFVPIPMLAFHCFQRKIKIWWLILFALLLLFTSTFIGLTRDVVGGNVGKMKEEYEYKAQSQVYNPITRSLLEFGASIKTVVIAMELIPSQHPYWYGTEYLQSLPGVIPNFIPGWVRTAQGIDVWITETAFGNLQFTHGRGGSIAMEAYTQFGFLGGVIFFVFLGFFYRRIYERFLNKPNFARTVMFFVFVCTLVFWIRNTIFVATRTIVWMLLVLWILQLFKKQPIDNQYELHQ